MTKCVIYSRVSTTAQDYEAQTNELLKYAAYKDMEVVQQFEEKVSGYNDEIERTEFERMKSFVISNDVKNILCWEISRFSRRTHIALKEIEFFTKHNVNIFFKKENINSLSDNDFNKVLLALLSSIAQMEKETLKARHRRGMLSGASKGMAHGLGVTPYGFKRDEEHHTLLINEDEAKWVQHIYELRLSGMGSAVIANELNKKGVYTKHRKNGRKRTLQTGEVIEILWRANTIRKILKSTLYKGVREYMGEKFSMPQIVSDKMWNDVQKTFADNMGYKLNTKYDYLFKGRVKCGRCGLAYLCRTDNNQCYYFCSGRKDLGIKCQNGQFKAQILDKFGWQMLTEFGQSLDAYKKEKFNKVNIEEVKNEIAFLKSEIQKSEGRRKRTVIAFTEGELSDDMYKKMIRKIKEDVKEWEEEIKDKEEQIKSQTNLVKDLDSGEIRRMMHSTLRNRMYIQKWVDKVVLTKWTGEHIEGTNGNDQVMLMKMYAFGMKEPIKAIVSSVSKVFRII